jgi:hypothetical protein
VNVERLKNCNAEIGMGEVGAGIAQKETKSAKGDGEKRRGKPGIFNR